MFWNLSICLNSIVSSWHDKNCHKKEVSWSVESKVRKITKIWKGRSNKDVSNQFSVPGSTISTCKKNKEKIFEVFQTSSLKLQTQETRTHEKLNEALMKWFPCVVTTFQLMVLFFWRKFMNLLKPSNITILQHRLDGWYFPWVLICSSNQNNVG